MDTITLDAQVRDRGESVRTLRKEKLVPGVVYGNTENTLLKLNGQELLRTYIKAGESTVVELKVGTKKLPVLFHSIDSDPLTDSFSHVDFYALDMTKEVTTHVPVHAEGDAPAVKALGGVLVTVASELTVTCLPKDLPHAFVINISKLEQFGDAITVADIVIPQGVKIKEEPSQIVFTVQEPRQAEPEPTAAPAEGEVAAAEGTTEGAAAAPADAAPAKDGK